MRIRGVVYYTKHETHWCQVAYNNCTVVTLNIIWCIYCTGVWDWNRVFLRYNLQGMRRYGKENYHSSLCEYFPSLDTALLSSLSCSFNSICTVSLRPGTARLYNWRSILYSGTRKILRGLPKWWLLSIVACSILLSWLSCWIKWRNWRN